MNEFDSIMAEFEETMNEFDEAYAGYESAMEDVEKLLGESTAEPTADVSTGPKPAAGD